MNDILEAARHEHEQLRRDRAAIDKRMSELEVVLRVLPTITGRRHVIELSETVGAHDTVSASVTTIKDRIIAQCEALLSDGRPRHTRDLVDALRGQGLVLNGKDPVLQVSAVLSREKDKFRADRSIGWTLLGVQKGEGPDVDASGPSDSRREPLNAVLQQPQP